MTRAFVTSCLLLALGPLGCGPRVNKPIGSTAAGDHLGKSDVHDTSVDQATNAVPVQETSPAVSEAAPADPDLPAEPSESMVATDRELEFTAERVILLTSLGPILIELQLSIDGRPHSQAMQRLADYVLGIADTDNSGDVTWDEVTSNPNFRSGRRGNVAINSEAERMKAIRLYDTTKNGIVDRDEVPRFMTRNAGGSQPFSFRSSNYFREINRIDSPMRLLLDTDRNGRLSADEISESTTRLKSRDADADDLLLPAEVGGPVQKEVGILTRRRASVPDSALHIRGRNSRKSEILHSLQDQYAFGRELDSSGFQIAPSLFVSLDVDENGIVDKTEIDRIAVVDPQLQLSARFGNFEEPKFELTYLSSEFGGPDQIVTRYDVKVVIELPGLELICFYRDSIDDADIQRQAQLQLSMYDKDKTGTSIKRNRPQNCSGWKKDSPASIWTATRKSELVSLWSIFAAVESASSARSVPVPVMTATRCL